MNKGLNMKISAMVKMAVLSFIFFCNITFATGAEVTLNIDTGNSLRRIEPGAVGWGAMWKKDMIFPRPGNLKTDADHRAFLERLAREGGALARKADLRNISWPWGVSFSTWGVNWENSVGPWSKRPVDCARIPLINRGSGWCEKSVVGVGDLMFLADRWELEALTVAVPLSVLDRTRVRWGPNFVTHAIDTGTMEKITAHAQGLISFMKSRPEWHRLERVYLSAGCEWRHYGQPSAVRTYAELIKKIRARITDPKVVIVASASDSADFEPFKANSWNRPLYEALKNRPGVALDLHRYRGMAGLTAGPDGSTAATLENVARLARTGVTQQGFFTVHPGQWHQKGEPMPSVLLENAIHGLIGDHATHSSQPWPWPVVIAHADLVREALASRALTFLGWTWFPEDLPREWPHGAIRQDGTLAKHAQAQAFLTRFHRGEFLRSQISDNSAVRANAVRGNSGRVRIYGGNFSMESHQLHLTGVNPGNAKVEYMGDKQIHKVAWDSRIPLVLPPMTLWRIIF